MSKSLKALFSWGITLSLRGHGLCIRCSKLRSLIIAMIAFWTRQNSQAAEAKSQQNALMYPLCSNSRHPFFHQLHYLNLSSFQIPCYTFGCSHCHSPRSAVTPSLLHSLTPSHLLTLSVPEGRWWQCCFSIQNTLKIQPIYVCIHTHTHTHTHRASWKYFITYTSNFYWDRDNRKLFSSSPVKVLNLGFRWFHPTVTFIQNYYSKSWD